MVLSPIYSLLVIKLLCLSIFLFFKKFKNHPGRLQEGTSGYQKEGFVVTKGKGLGRIGGEGGRRELRGNIISTPNIGRSWGRQCGTKTSNVSIVTAMG